MKNILSFLAFVMVLNLAFSCKESAKPATTLTLQFTVMVAEKSLKLNTDRYQNANGDTYSIEKFAFYLSNLKFKNSKTGQSYVVPKSYHLINLQNNNTFSFTLNDVPAGDYDILEYGLGVDAKQNTSLDQIGDLDPANGMAWDWNTGYKFISLEGRFFPPNTENVRGLVYHIGSNENYRTYQLALNKAETPNSTKPLQIKSSEVNVLKLKVNIAEMFANPHKIDFSKNSTVMGGEEAAKVAENCAAMISLD
jgi:hypothetical protein